MIDGLGGLIHTERQQLLQVYNRGNNLLILFLVCEYKLMTPIIYWFI